MVDRRSKAYKDIMIHMPKADNAIEETLDGQEFRYYPEPRCRVCTADEGRKALSNGPQVRRLVDSLILYPKSLADIHRTIEPMMHDWPSKYRITYKSIRTHQAKHMAWDSLALRMMVERWAQEKGMSIIDASGRMLLTEEAWLEATAQLGWQRLITGQLEPSWAETQKAFERIADIKTMAEGEFSTALLLAQLNTIIEVVREELPADRWPVLLARLANRRDEVQGELPPPVPDSAEDLFEEIVAEAEKLQREE